MLLAFVSPSLMLNSPLPTIPANNSFMPLKLISLSLLMLSSEPSIITLLKVTAPLVLSIKAPVPLAVPVTLMSLILKLFSLSSNTKPLWPPMSIVERSSPSITPSILNVPVPMLPKSTLKL